MTTFKYVDLLKVIANHYGFENQCKKLTEEMAELTVAVHHLRDRQDDKYKIEFCEEFADVLILMEQLALLMPTEYKALVEEYKIYKVQRQVNRIDEDKKRCQK